MSDRYIMDTFKEYVGVKLHFNDKNFIYNSPKQLSRYTVDTLKKRRDSSFFIRLARRFDRSPEDRLQFIVSQFKSDKNAWIGDFFTPSSDEIHNKRMKVINSIGYYVNKDIDDIIDKYHDRSLSDILKVNLDRPLIYKDMKLNDETLIVIDELFPFEDESYNPLWADNLMMYRKYKHFVPTDKVLELVDSKLKSGFAKSNVAEQAETTNTLDHLFN